MTFTITTKDILFFIGRWLFSDHWLALHWVIDIFQRDSDGQLPITANWRHRDKMQLLVSAACSLLGCFAGTIVAAAHQVFLHPDNFSIFNFRLVLRMPASASWQNVSGNLNIVYMKTLLQTILLSLLTNICFGQPDTIFLDQNKKKCTRTLAKQYRLVIKDHDKLLIKDYYLNSELQMIAECASLEPFIRNGKCTTYNEDGHKMNSGYYTNDKKSGVWTWWEEDGKDSLIGEFKNDGTIYVLNKGHYSILHGRKQFIVSEGEGSPTIVFLSGLGDPQYYFRHVYKEIKNTNRIVAYDRAGLGNSESISNQRRVDTMAYELHSLLAKEGIKPPFILVGHSMGGYVMRCFANMYPKELAGLIFIDPAVETQFKECLAVRTDEDRKEYKKMYYSYLHRPDWTQGLNDEAKYIFDNDSTGYSTNGKIVKDLKIPRDIPVTFIVSTQTNPELPYSMQDNNVRLIYFRSLKKEIPQIKLVETSKSGHYIHDEEPSLVIGEIKKMLDAIKTNSR